MAVDWNFRQSGMHSLDLIMNVKQSNCHLIMNNLEKKKINLTLTFQPSPLCLVDRGVGLKWFAPPNHQKNKTHGGGGGGGEAPLETVSQVWYRYCRIARLKNKHKTCVMQHWHFASVLPWKQSSWLTGYWKSQLSVAVHLLQVWELLVKISCKCYSKGVTHSSGWSAFTFCATEET